MAKDSAQYGQKNLSKTIKSKLLQRSDKDVCFCGVSKFASNLVSEYILELDGGKFISHLEVNDNLAKNRWWTDFYYAVKLALCRPENLLFKVNYFLANLMFTFQQILVQHTLIFNLNKFLSIICKHFYWLFLIKIKRHNHSLHTDPHSKRYKTYKIMLISLN